MDVMKHIDYCLKWDRLEVTPFLLLEGHGSHFELPFLDYVNSHKKQSGLSAGVPHGW
jgi:hypothetical protein